MECKHFSHQHPLAFHQLHQGSQTHCSGCKSPATGNVYACWQCSYFLHEQCFSATRSLKHPAHPLHPLSLVPIPTHPSSSFLCDSCNLAGNGFSYTCSHCDFDIHLHCALTPNPNPHASPSPLTPHNFINPIYPPPFSPYPPQNATIPHHSHNCSQSQTTTNTCPPNTILPNQTQNNPPFGYPQANATPQSSINPPPPQTPTNGEPNAPLGYPQTNAPPQLSATIKHFSHPHGLKQVNVDAGTEKLCSACELTLSGSSYCCTEPHCIFSLHKACFDSPREVRHKSHPHHALTLLTAPPYSSGSFTCDACRKGGKAFAYTCSTCSYDLHIDCIRWPEMLTRPDHKHSLVLHYVSPAAVKGGGAVFLCLACREAADEKAWVYYCRECDFGTHLECANAEIKLQSAAAGEGASGEDELLRFQMQKMNLDFQLQMVKQHGEFMASLANSWSI